MLSRIKFYINYFKSYTLDGFFNCLNIYTNN